MNRSHFVGRLVFLRYGDAAFPSCVCALFVCVFVPRSFFAALNAIPLPSPVSDVDILPKLDSVPYPDLRQARCICGIGGGFARTCGQSRGSPAHVLYTCCVFASVSLKCVCVLCLRVGQNAKIVTHTVERRRTAKATADRDDRKRAVEEEETLLPVASTSPPPPPPQICLH